MKCSRPDCRNHATHELVIPEGRTETRTSMCAECGRAAFTARVHRNLAAALVCVDRNQVCPPEGA